MKRKQRKDTVLVEEWWTPRIGRLKAGAADRCGVVKISTGGLKAKENGILFDLFFPSASPGPKRKTELFGALLGFDEA